MTGMWEDLWSAFDRENMVQICDLRGNLGGVTPADTVQCVRSPTYVTWHNTIDNNNIYYKDFDLRIDENMDYSITWGTDYKYGVKFVHTEHKDDDLASVSDEELMSIIEVGEDK